MPVRPPARPMSDPRGRYAYDDDFASVPEPPTESAHWDRWHYGIVLGLAVMLWGIYAWSLLPWALGFVAVPTCIHLDIRYVESVSTSWQPDRGVYVLGSILVMFLFAPLYLFRRWETVGL